jgi:(E)-4-hydroxy-3-methylbut-2-enyl-diphosphate synthase
MNDLEERLEDVNTSMDVAIIGCIVNGPGEAKVADLGLTGGSPRNLLYLDGKPNQKLENATLTDDLERLIREQVAKRKEQEEAVIARSTD